MASRRDPYETLGVRRSATDAEVRAAYRRLVQLHHPDHNHGSAESEQRFEEVQDAYAEVRRLRATSAGASGGRGAAGAAGTASGSQSGGGAATGGDDIDARLAEMERELKLARDARERATQDARKAHDDAIRDARKVASDLAGNRTGERPTDEELGYIKTDDSFSKIFDDVASDLSERVSGAGRKHATDRLADVIEELGSKLSGDRRRPKP